MKKSLLLASLLFYSYAALASEDHISLAHLQPYTAEFDYFLMGDNGALEKAGTWTDSVEIDDRRIVRTVTRKTLAGGTDLVRVVAADKGTLAPLHLTQRFGTDLAGFYHSQVRGEQLTQVFMPDNRTPARIESAPIPEAVVEVNLQGLFAAALPLHAGREISVAAYRGGATPSGERQVFKVIGQEAVNLNGKELLAWKVQQPQTGWTYWVRKESPYLLKVAHPSPSGGTLVSYLVRYEGTQLNGLTTPDKATP